MYSRPLLGRLVERCSEPRRFIQVLIGPRQVGKTTLARQLVERLSIDSHIASADLPTIESGAWIEQQWEIARLRMRD